MVIMVSGPKICFEKLATMNSRNSEYFGFLCVYQWRKLYLELQLFTETGLVKLRFYLAIQI